MAGPVPKTDKVFSATSSARMRCAEAREIPSRCTQTLVEIQPEALTSLMMASFGERGAAGSAAAGDSAVPDNEPESFLLGDNSTTRQS